MIGDRVMFCGACGAEWWVAAAVGGECPPLRINDYMADGIDHGSIPYGRVFRAPISQRRYLIPITNGQTLNLELLSSPLPPWPQIRWYGGW